ncbi:MAG: TetR/AcrR family transcriptional regulator C-terminal domain-containing protein [Chloroflexi bacterium]|nr:TetR/AcrR family transcriptional regulator C-terminal domain-containing protein [Chloroflexota bacterium]
MTKLLTPPDRTATRRRPLSRDRVLRAAILLADEGGLESVSMRKLGQALRVEAMSLYKHVANKDDILDGVADLVMGDFEVPSGDVDWKTAIRRGAISAHQALLHHPWASSLIESRANAGPARLRYLDAVIGVLSGAGFTMPMVMRAIMALDSHTYGFVLQELAWPFDDEHAPEVAAAFARGLPAGEFPNLLAMAEMVSRAPGGVPAAFEFGLDLILDGLERLRDTARH